MKNMFLAAALAALMSSAASADDVLYNFDRQADFSLFRTYKWVDVPKANDQLDQQIRLLVDAELTSKGMNQVTTDKADLLVSYQTVMGGVGKPKEFVTAMGWGFGPGWGGWYGPMGVLTTEEFKMKYTGTLAVDIYDASKHVLIWRGVVTKTLHPDATADKQQKNLDKAVHKLFDKYPPKP